jgi:signal transduction histidine kinase
VTDKIVSRNIIEKQKQELEVIIENISDQLILFNKDGEYIKMNKLARDKAMFNIKAAKNFNEAYDEVKIYDMKDNLLSVEDVPLKRVIRGETFSNVRVIRKNCEYTQYTSISGTPIYDDNCNFIAGVLIMRDITDEVKYEENLYIKAQYDSLSKIIDNLDLGFVRLTYPEFNFIDINNKAYEQLKLINPNIVLQSSIKGKNLYDVFLEEPHMKELLHTSSKNNSFFEIRNFNVEGEDVFYKIIYQPLYGFNNEIVEIIVFWIDVTEEEKSKEILEDTLKMQEEMYSNVAHELKTPLNVIFSANQLLLMYLKNDLFEENKAKFYIYSNSIKQNCYRLTKLINNIVDLSKSQAGYLKLNLSNENVVEIIENIASSVSDYVKSRELRIVFFSNVEEKIIACDPIKIERVMLNLISNAIKFTNPNGAIYINVLDKGDTVEISVKDTGIGIEKEHLDLLFEKFYQIDKTLSRNAEGSGIGLSLTKSIVDLHGGNISVDSEIGKGSVFKIELPASTIEKKRAKEQTQYNDNKIETINIEFSDIYSND